MQHEKGRACPLTQTSPDPDVQKPTAPQPIFTVLKSRKLLPNVSSQAPGPTTSRTVDGRNAFARKKSTSLPEDDLNRIYSELEEKLKAVEPTAPDQMRDKFLKSIMGGAQRRLATSAACKRSPTHLEDLA